MVTKPAEKTIAVRVLPPGALESTCRPWPNSPYWPPAPQNRTCANGNMGHRLSKIVTRTGDAGTTGLGDGSRVAKDSARIEAIGAIDELNSTLGVLLAEPLPAGVAECLVEVQHDLFDVGGELSIPGAATVSETQVTRVEEALARFNADLAPLKEFVLPGGTRAASYAHVARTVCRRAERSLVHLGATATVRDPVRKYVNRLSDLLFVLARVLNRDAGQADVLWRKDRRRA
jgi:cob(I)alamin adenosyltransferase